MTKKNLLISTHADSSHLFNFYKELHTSNFEILIYSSNKDLLKKAQDDNIENKKIFTPLHTNSSTLYFIIYLLIFLPNTIRIFIQLITLRRKNKVNNLILTNWPEKIFYTPVSQILKINTIWINAPEEKIRTNTFSTQLCRIYSKKISLISLSEFTKTQLVNKGFKEEKIKNINLGIKPSNYQTQENIFNELAENNHINSKKFFTIGTIISQESNKNIELLFSAIKDCTNLIPNLQLIVITNSENQKKLKWLSEKLNISTIVWFIGNKNSYRKWFNNFDIFTITFNNLKTINIQTILRAMNHKLPLIGPINIGLDDIINKDNGILCDFSDSKEITKNIIKLWKHKDFRLELGENAKTTVDKNFSLATMVDKLKQFLK